MGPFRRLGVLSTHRCHHDEPPRRSPLCLCDDPFLVFLFDAAAFLEMRVQVQYVTWLMYVLSFFFFMRLGCSL